MKKRLEERILEEIRRIVIEKDLKRQTEEEKDEMREANIEALQDLTSLSRQEIEKISADVRKTFVSQHKKKQQRNTRIAIGVGVLAIIAFFIFKPEREPVITTFTDDFSQNANNWSLFQDFNYKRYITNNQYVFEINKDDWCYWDDAKVDFPENYDVEVSSTWMKGKFSSYGVGLNENNSNYYAFSIRGDGASTFGKVIDKKWVIEDSWESNSANSGKNQTNIQKIEVRGNSFKYYVNDKLIREGGINLNIKTLTLRGCGEQVVAFNSIKITNAKTSDVVFEENFGNEPGIWEPKKDYQLDSYFNEGEFIMDSNDEDNCYWANSTIRITENCEIKLSSKWLTGDLSTYGVMIAKNDENYYSFELMNDGKARLVERLDGEYSYVQNYVYTNFESDGYKTNDQKVVIKDGEISYFVNDVPIDEYFSKLEFPVTLYLRICGKQKIAYDYLEIKYFE